MKYIALLRGINVGGNNKVSMAELKQCFEGLGFTDVSTYINSGNVVFDADSEDVALLINQCEAAIQKTFGFHVVCSVISAADLRDAVDNAPNWWGVDNGNKHNAIFVIQPATAPEIMKEIGEVKPEYEQVSYGGPVIFWTAPIETFARTRYAKIVGTRAYQSVTMRNSNTAKKLVALVS